MPNWLPWAPLVAAILHLTEEFVLPGGFPAWYRAYRTDASRVTTRFLVIVNAALLIACLNTVQLGHTMAGAVAWLTIMALLCSNGIWHLWATLKSHTYSPGVVTGIAIYVPLALFGFALALRSGAVSKISMLIAAVIGGSYHFWSALYHGSLRIFSRKHVS